jgi:hypothetical protein
MILKHKIPPITGLPVCGLQTDTCEIQTWRTKAVNSSLPDTPDEAAIERILIDMRGQLYLDA